RAQRGPGTARWFQERASSWLVSRCLNVHAESTLMLSAWRKLSLKRQIIDFMLVKRFVNEGRPAMTKAHVLALSPQDPPPGSQIEDAYRRLRDDIISGALVPAEKLRIEHLRQRYGIGASALREALSRLVSDGLVECEAQRGYWV